MKRNNIILWLDDMRDPNNYKDFYINQYVRDCDEIVWVKNYREFCNYLNSNEFPAYVFFDHDLGEELTGYDCCKYMVDFLMDNNIDPNDYHFIVQSANPVGRENIYGLVNNYIKYYNNNCIECYDKI